MMVDLTVNEHGQKPLVDVIINHCIHLSPIVMLFPFGFGRIGEGLGISQTVHNYPLDNQNKIWYNVFRN